MRTQAHVAQHAGRPSVGTCVGQPSVHGRPGPVLLHGPQWTMGHWWSMGVAWTIHAWFKIFLHDSMAHITIDHDRMAEDESRLDQVNGGSDVHDQIALV